MTRNHIGVDLSKDFLDVCDPRRGAARVPNRPEEVSGWVGGPRARRRDRLRGDQRLRPRAAPRGARPPASPASDWIRCTPGTSPARSTSPRPTGSRRMRAPARRGHARPPRRRAPARARPGPRSRARGSPRPRPAPGSAQAHGSAGEERRAACPLEAVAAGIGEMLAILAAHIERIDQAIAEHVSRHPGLKSADRLLRSIPGFGAVAAVTMLAHVPELGTVSRRAAACSAASRPARGTRPPPRQALHRRRPAPRQAGALKAAMSLTAPPRLPRGLHCAQEGRGEAGEADFHRRGATAPDHRQRRPPDGHPLPAKHRPAT